jgi:glycosyltransferase involved in cell wall biosynthesis
MDGDAAVSGAGRLLARPATLPAQSIAIVLHDLSAGGTERIAIRLAKRWAELGREVRLVCGAQDGPLRPLIDPKVAFEPLHPGVPRGPGALRRLTRAVAGRLDAAPCDLLFVPGNHHWEVAECAALLPPSRRPCVVAQISNPMRREDRGRLRQTLYDVRARRLMGHVTTAVALTEAAAAEADEVLGRRMTLALPLPALEDAAGAPAPPPGGPPLVLAVGRLVAQKDFGLAITAFARVRTPGARLVIVGEGPERPRLARLIAELGLEERVELAGYAADVRPMLDRARALLVSSRFEGYGAVVIEALAAGRPVVATPCGGAVTELLAGGTAGIVAAGRDPQALASALERQLATPPPAPSTLARLVERFRIGPVAEAYLETFDAARIRAATAPSRVAGPLAAPFVRRSRRPGFAPV